MLTEKLKQERKDKIEAIHKTLRDSGITSKQASEFWGVKHRSFETMLHSRSFSYVAAIEMYDELDDLKDFYSE